MRFRRSFRKFRYIPSEIKSDHTCREHLVLHIKQDDYKGKIKTELFPKFFRILFLKKIPIFSRIGIGMSGSEFRERFRWKQIVKEQ